MVKTTYLIKEFLNMALIPLNSAISSRAWFRPTIAVLFLTKKCNSRCLICEYWKNTDHSDELDTESWIRVIDEIKNLGIQCINFTSDGEILMRRDAFAIMNHAKDLGILITINTNGLMLHRHIDEILELDPLQIQVSLDVFSDPEYEKMRGVYMGYSRVRCNILELKDRGYSRISVGSVLTRHNLPDLEILQKFCMEHGLIYRVTAYQFQGFNTDQRNQRHHYQTSSFLLALKKTINVLTAAPINNTRFYLKSIPRYYNQAKFHPLNCIVGFYKIFILPNGDVSLCNIMHENAGIGNIKKRSIKSLWFSREADVVRKKIKEKKCPSCWLSCFAEDNIRFSPMMLIQNLAYFWKKTGRLFLR
jgi:Fe-coproporphyrin III synthase